MNAPYYRRFFNSYLSIHAKTDKEALKAIDKLEEVESTIEHLYKRGGKKSVKEAGEFVKSVIKNRKLKVEIVFDGNYLIDYNAKTNKYKEF